MDTSRLNPHLAGVRCFACDAAHDPRHLPTVCGTAPGRMPRFVSVQASGGAPVAKAFRDGAAKTEPWLNARTEACGLRVPSPLRGFIGPRARVVVFNTGTGLEYRNPAQGCS